MAVSSKLRDTGRPTGMEVGSDIVAVSTGVEDQTVRRLIANRIEEIDDALNGCYTRRCNTGRRRKLIGAE